MESTLDEVIIISTGLQMRQQLAAVKILYSFWQEFTPRIIYLDTI